MSQTITELQLSRLTLICTTFSLFGSICVIGSYIIARTKTNPKAAQLILNLAVTDFFWFLASLLEFSFLVSISSPGVPDLVCLLSSPIIVFTRQASLVWQCAISFDVYMSLNRRKWLWKGEESRWNAYRRTYIILVLIFSSPAAIVAMVKQHSGESNLGCSPGYEKLGSWSEIFFSEIFPIVICFFFNLFIFFMVRSQMKLKAFPQSVRKRRRRIQYYYIIACIVCWTPTIVFYLFEMSEAEGRFMDVLEILSRITLYLSGFVNFLIFGASDPHLRRSMLVMAHTIGLSRFIDTSAVVIQNSPSSSTNLQQLLSENGAGRPTSDSDSISAQSHFILSSALRSHSTEKIVMFGGVISDNADISHDRNHCYNLLLGPEEKERLYRSRPDLDPHAPLPVAPKPKSILKKNKASRMSRVSELSTDDLQPSNSLRSTFTDTEYEDSNDSVSTENRLSLSTEPTSTPAATPERPKQKKSATFSTQPAQEIEPVLQPPPSPEERKSETDLRLSDLTMRQDSEELSLLSDAMDPPKMGGEVFYPKKGGDASPPTSAPPYSQVQPRSSSTASQQNDTSFTSRPRRLSDTAATLFSLVTGSRRNSADADTNRVDIEQPLLGGSPTHTPDDSSSDEEDEEDRELKKPLKKIPK